MLLRWFTSRARCRIERRRAEQAHRSHVLRRARPRVEELETRLAPESVISLTDNTAPLVLSSGSLTLAASSSASESFTLTTGSWFVLMRVGVIAPGTPPGTPASVTRLRAEGYRAVEMELGAARGAELRAGRRSALTAVLSPAAHLVHRRQLVLSGQQRRVAVRVACHRSRR
jgi:hypothetical protein